MDSRLILIFSFCLLYAIFEFLMSRVYSGNRNITVSGDKGSIWILIASIGSGYWLAFISASIKLTRLSNWNAWIIAGGVIVLAGLIIRISSILTLKKQFTYQVMSVEDNNLIETGFYKIIRHPGYLGQLLIFLGISVSLANWLSVAGMIIPVIAGFLYRISVEEKFMEKTMGTKYRDYKMRTKKLIPYIF